MCEINVLQYFAMINLRFSKEINRKAEREKKKEETVVYADDGATVVFGFLLQGENTERTRGQIPYLCKN